VADNVERAVQFFFDNACKFFECKCVSREIIDSAALAFGKAVAGQVEHRNCKSVVEQIFDELTKRAAVDEIAVDNYYSCPIVLWLKGWPINFCPPELKLKDLCSTPSKSRP
jgi:hypothetical protein